MNIILFMVLMLMSTMADAFLTPGVIPVTKTGGATPTVQNGSITDTGTALGVGNVGIGSSSPVSNLDVYGTIRVSNFILTGSETLAYGQVSVNSFFFGNAGNATSTGTANTAVGSQALLALTSGIQNTSLGYYTNVQNTSGSYNTAIGSESLYGNGSYNTGVGVNALGIISTGSNDTCIGYNCLVYSTTGNYNVAIGNNSGLGSVTGIHTNVTGTEETFLGSSAYALNDGDTNETVIGYNATGNGSNSTTIGSSANTLTVLTGNVGVGTITPASLLDVEGTIYAKTFSIGIGTTSLSHLCVAASTKVVQLCP